MLACGDRAARIDGGDEVAGVIDEGGHADAGDVHRDQPALGVVGEGGDVAQRVGDLGEVAGRVVGDLRGVAEGVDDGNRTAVGVVDGLGLLAERVDGEQWSSGEVEAGARVLQKLLAGVFPGFGADFLWVEGGEATEVVMGKAFGACAE